MTSKAPDAKAASATNITQMRATLAQSWIEQEQERLRDSFLQALRAVMTHCEQLRDELDRQRLLERQAEAGLTLADKLRLKVGVSLSSSHMSAAAQQLPEIRARIDELQEEIALNSPGAEHLPPGQSSMLSRAVALNDAALKRAQAADNAERAAWVETQLQNLLSHERKQQAEARKKANAEPIRRKSSRSNVELTVIVQGAGGTLSGVTRDISDTGVYVQLEGADQMFSEGELLTVQVSDLPAEATAVRGVAVRVGANGLGVHLLSSKNTLKPPPSV